MDGNYTLSDIAAVTDGNRNNGGMFGGNGDWGAWIILFLLFGMFGRGGWGGFGGGNGGNGCTVPCATQADVRAAVDQQTLISKLDQQTYGLADSTYALNNTMQNGFFGVERGFCDIGRQISDCCCTTQRAIDGVNFQMAKGFCDLGNTMNSNTRDLLENQNTNTRAILDFLTQDKIATLTAENAKPTDSKVRVVNHELGKRPDFVVVTASTFPDAVSTTIISAWCMTQALKEAVGANRTLAYTTKGASYDGGGGATFIEQENGSFIHSANDISFTLGKEDYKYGEFTPSVGYHWIAIAGLT